MYLLDKKKLRELHQQWIADLSPMLKDAEEFVDSFFWEAFRPDERFNVPDWCDRNRILVSSSSKEPGRWRTDRTPYLRELLENLEPDSGVEETILCKGSQLGGTELLFNFLGYIIDQCPGPTMLVTATLELAKEVSKQRIGPMISASPVLQGKVRDVLASGAKSKSETTLLKEFDGGFLKLAGANSAASLRSMPVRFLLMDEISAWKRGIGAEGDPEDLARRGQRTYGSRKKTVVVSTPGTRGLCKVSKLLEESDQRYFLVPCPRCGEFQKITWSKLEFERENDVPVEVLLRCEFCEDLIEEKHKTAMMAEGNWVAERPDLESERRGYHLSALYSPIGMYSWLDAAKAHRKATKPVVNVEKLQVWVNQTLGEEWHDDEDPPKWELLFNRREPYKIGTIPAGGLILTAGADVQKDRIEYEVVAWGEGLESWSVDYAVLDGSPTKPEVWKELEKLLSRRFPHENGLDMTVRMLAIDSRYETTEVHRWVYRQPLERVIAVQGKAGLAVPVGHPRAVQVDIGGTMRRGTRVFPVGVDKLKSELYGWLRFDQPTEPETTGYPPGYLHFPEYPDEWFKQITAERAIRRVHRGAVNYEWEKTRDRNEALDIRNYARAAAMVVGVDRWQKEDWEQLRKQLERRDDQPTTRSSGGFLKRWR